MLDNISDRAGWSWQELANEQVPLVWPLLTIAGAGLTREAWQRLAARWLELTEYGAGGLGAVRTRSGAFVAIAGYRFVGVQSLRSMRLGFLRVLELAGEPIVLRAVLRALRRIADSKDCTEVVILAEPGDHYDLADSLEQCGREFRAESCDNGWRLPLDGRGNVVSLMDARV